MKIIPFFGFLLLFGCVAEQKKEIETNKVTRKLKSTNFKIKKDSLFESYIHSLDTASVLYSAQSDSVFINTFVGSFNNRDFVISIFIDKLINDSVFGHSIVAGNFQTFKGIRKKENGISTVVGFEPGTAREDGVFTFTLTDSIIEGNWKAYKKLKIGEFSYKLKAKEFIYNSENTLNEDEFYVNYKKEKTVKYEYEIEEGKKIEEVLSQYATTTPALFKYNASAQELNEEDLKELKKSDLMILRNSIFARHGFSFKNESLNYFFGWQSWYMPVSINVTGELTELEKKNIELIARFEKYAEEAYDSFGR